ncbi:MAG: hypothetical protein ACI9P5_004831, partial [Saprospiraceae bacterium]
MGRQWVNDGYALQKRTSGDALQKRTSGLIA